MLIYIKQLYLMNTLHSLSKLYPGLSVQRLRPPWCDVRYQGDQPANIKNIFHKHNFLKSGLGQGFPVKLP